MQRSSLLRFFCEIWILLIESVGAWSFMGLAGWVPLREARSVHRLVLERAWRALRNRAKSVGLILTDLKRLSFGVCCAAFCWVGEARIIATSSKQSLGLRRILTRAGSSKIQKASPGSGYQIIITLRVC